MPSGREFATLTLDEMVQRVCRTLSIAEAGDVPFTVLLGAGFSFPVIPTAGQMLRAVPEWMRRRERSPDPLEKYQEEFWSRVTTETRKTGGTLALERDGRPDLSLPESVGVAYQATMLHGLYPPKLRREFLRSIISKAGSTINPAHLFLAGILKAQEDWQWPVPFCRTVFTTNFDPLLQYGLQLVNKLYYMTDRPDTIEDPSEEDQEAIHVVYSHGSVHRYWLATTGSQIQRVTEKAPRLINYFRRHGVIVMGYSGWADVCMEALGECQSFDLGLYWCDVHPADLAASRLRSEVKDLLAKNNDDRFYVHLPNGSDDAMLRLHASLGCGATPRLVLDPLTSMIHGLASISVTETERTGSSESRGAGRARRREADPARDLGAALNRTQERLDLAKRVFDDPEVMQGAVAAVVAKLMNEASELYSAGSADRAIERWTEVIEREGVPPELRAKALFYRGSARGAEGDVQGEETAYSEMIEMAEIPALWRGWALVNRGIIRDDKGDLQGALADYEEALAIPEAVPSQRARALVNRGLIRGSGSDQEGELADYEAVIQMEEAPTEFRVLALLNRAAVRESQLDLEGALSDYEAVLQMSDAPVDQRVTALMGRAEIRNTLRDTSGALEDYTSVIEMPGVPPEQQATALNYRADIRDKRGDQVGTLEDYATVIAMPEAPAEERLQALLGRAEIRNNQGNKLGARADYEAAIELPDAPAEAFTDLAWLHFEAEDYERFVQYSERALRLGSRAPWIRANLGLGLLHLGRTEDAVEAYQAAVAAIDSLKDLADMVENDLVEAGDKRPGLAGLEAVLETVHARRTELLSKEGTEEMGKEDPQAESNLGET